MSAHGCMVVGLSLCLVTVARAEAPLPGAPEGPPEAEPGATGSGLFEQSLRAAPAPVSASTREQGTPSGVALEVHGYARADAFVGKASGSSTPEVKAAYGELALRLELDQESYGDAFAEVRLRSTAEGERPGIVVDLREAYLNAYLGPLDLRVGHQIIVWGRADAFNPTNNLTPFDLRTRSPIEDDRRLANSAVRLWLNLAPLRLEGVWVPLYAAAELPAIEPGEFVSLSEAGLPGPALTNGLGALRVHLELPAVEASLSFLHGYAPLPGLALSGFTAGVDPPEVRVARTAYEQHVVGVDFSTAVGDIFALRGEAAYRHPLDHERKVYAPRPDLQYVLGADRAFGPVSIIAQYLGRYVFDWQFEPGPADPISPAVLSSFTPPLGQFLEQMITGSIEAELRVRNQILFSQRAEIQHLASLRAEWLTLHETLSVSALGLFNATTEEWLLYPKLSYRISDWVSASVGAEIYAGPEGSLFGLIDEIQSAGYAELKSSF